MLNRPIALVLFFLGATGNCAASETVDYRRDVLPLLSDRCFHCHGPDEHARQADLRLDAAPSATSDRDGYRVVAPGRADESRLIARVTANDNSRMPPVSSGKPPLSAGEVELLRRWIDSGAQWQQHWAFEPVVRPAVPDVAGGAWPSGVIDHYVAARLKAEGLAPKEPADRHTLVRRLYFDLTGLPPSAAEVEQFVDDSSADAYDRLVERLLASPHFGERMALDWLDAARYADTNGYSIDGGRHMWLWRDWVIDAYNRNKPYDEFLIEQLAGDLLPNATDAQLIATGFQRNNMVTHEGGTIPAENLTNYNADRVKTIGESILGLTVGCAQCHDHKYDPITQRDYYRLFAFFNTIGDQGLDGNAGVNPRPYVALRTVLQTGEEETLSHQIARLQQRLAHPDPARVATWIDEQRRTLARRGTGLELHPARALRVSTPNSGSGFEVSDGKYIRIPSPPGFAAFDAVVQLPENAEPVTGIRVFFHPDESAPGGGIGHGKLPGDDSASTFVLTALSMSADVVPGDQVNLHRLIGASQTTASSWRKGYHPRHVLDTRRNSGWSPQSDGRAPQHITYTFADPINAAATPFLTVQLNFGMGDRLVGARMEVQAVAGKDDGSNLPPNVIAAVQATDEQRTDEQRDLLQEYFAANSDEMRPLRIDLANAQERLAVITEPHSTMVMAESDQPRKTFILHRGDYSQPTVQVTAGTPDFLPPLPDGAPANRLGLAQWVVAPRHPLTSRVAVNRIWRLFFGSGLVRTPSDFGAQGAYPSHPELLDWLAVEFEDSGWDVKHIVRLIVTSSTYRQSAVASNELLARDPRNELLARGPRFRLPAELIRDSALKTSGLLVPRIGGPSVNPYTPGDLWREVSHYGSSPATAQTFVQDHGEKLYRRSLYTYWKRTVPPPNMVAFDAPNRETCVVDRATTNTPLQALVLLNDPQFVEAARALAERIIASGPADDDRLRWAVVESLSRPASAAELEILQAALARERERYTADPEAATELLAVGESPRDQQLPAAEHAAWTQIALTLLNLSETITRN